MELGMYLLLAVIGAVSAVALHAFTVSRKHNNNLTGVPRLGNPPSFLGNTTQSSFQKESKDLIAEGYRRYRKQVYSLCTTGMDRAIVPHDFLPELAKLPRHQLRLTASVRHAGEYTGMFIAERGTIAHSIISVNLTQNIGALIRPAYVQLRNALNEKVKSVDQDNGYHQLNVHQLITHLVSYSTALSLLGPELCTNQEWLTTAIGYARDAVAVQRELGKYWRATWPVVAPFLASYKRLLGRFESARRFLGPEIEKRKALAATGEQQPKDILQWLVNQSRGDDATVDMISRRMLFISHASIDTTGLTLTSVIFELLGNPEHCDMLRQEWQSILPDPSEVAYDHLKAMKLTDSFMKESQRMNPIGLITFNRQLDVPVGLPDGTHLPSGTYFSVPQWPVMRDPSIYEDPDTFHPERFVQLNEKDGSDSWNWASQNRDWPGWGSGKFTCPGRLWANAQMKLILICLLTEFDVSLPKGQSGRPKNNVRGESNLPDFGQLMRLKQRKVAA